MCSLPCFSVIFAKEKSFSDFMFVLLIDKALVKRGLSLQGICS